MIDRPPGWSWDVRASGITMTRGTEHVRYVERAAPLRRLVDIARDVAPAAWRPTGGLAIERFATCEDELALLGTESGTLGGTPSVRALAMVCLDDWYALVDGIALGPDLPPIAATVRALATSDTHGRGERRRRFVYEPPAGWSGLRVAPYHAYWFAPGYPRCDTFMVMFPAQPRRSTPEQLAATLTTLDTEHVVQSPALVSTKRGLSGIQVDAKVTRSTSRRTIVVLEDRAYQYPVLLHAPVERAGELSPILASVIDSIEPLSMARREPPVSVWAID